MSYKPKIDCTQEMLEAGAEVIKSGVAECQDWSDREELAEAVFNAMLKASDQAASAADTVKYQLYAALRLL